ncbi:MAG: AAA family ATPase [Prevotellaceae bacterium]|jgi:predicted ATPase|nr:AAA family ATPase [Prevotellaceae bacterium]
MIEHIEIEKLWGRYDINLTLHPDVNILAGINGSGKSTLLKLLEQSFNYKKKSGVDMFHFYYAIKITGKEVDINIINGLCASHKYNFDIDCINTFEGIFHESYKEDRPRETVVPLTSFIQNMVYETRHRSLNNFRLRATENPLDRHRIDRLQKWTDIVNSFFVTTQKSFVMKGREVFFKQADGYDIQLKDLSSGEKKLLIILIKALVQDENPFILLMDEPEISLDIDWQYRLIDTIRTINPSCQLIIATHSPAIFGDGWNDKLFFMEDIMK